MNIDGSNLFYDLNAKTAIWSLFISTSISCLCLLNRSVAWALYSAALIIYQLILWIDPINRSYQSILLIDHTKTITYKLLIKRTDLWFIYFK